MKDKIQNKLAELSKAKVQLLAQLNACNGAIQVLEQLLKEGENG